jgi:hypothetical protein
MRRPVISAPSAEMTAREKRGRQRLTTEVGSTALCNAPVAEVPWPVMEG